MQGQLRTYMGGKTWWTYEQSIQDWPQTCMGNQDFKLLAEYIGKYT